MRIFSRWAASGRYRLPMPVLRLLERELGRRRNKAAADRAHRLAGFLAQMHAASGRQFRLERRKLAQAHPELGTIDQIRTAIEILEEIGFVVRVKARTDYKIVGGQVRRKALNWNFGQIFERCFSFCRNSPNKECSNLISISIKAKPSEKKKILNTFIGGVAARPARPPLPIEINPALERVLARLGRAVAGQGAC